MKVQKRSTELSEVLYQSYSVGILLIGVNLFTFLHVVARNDLGHLSRLFSFLELTTWHLLFIIFLKECRNINFMAQKAALIA